MTYWLNTYMTPFVLHKSTYPHVKKGAAAYPDHWTEYPTKDTAEAAGRSTLRRVQDCKTCFKPSRPGRLRLPGEPSP